MLHCLTLKSSTSSPATHPTGLQGEGNSSVDTPTTPGTSAVPSPTVNLSREYALAVQSRSYNEIWSKIHVVEQWESEEPNHQQQLLLADVLEPNREFVQQALQNAKPSTFIQLVSTYFEHSEKACHLLLRLYYSIRHARLLYAPVHDLVDDLPTHTDSMTRLECDHAFDTFVQFDEAGNPFPCPVSHNFHDMRSRFYELKQQVDQSLRKSRGKVRLVRRATTTSAVCLVGTVVGVVVSAIVVASHAMLALVAASMLPGFLPSRFTKREIFHMAQLDNAAKTAYVLYNDLDTIDRLVSRLHAAVEGDKLLIRQGLSMGRDKHPICEVLKKLGKSPINILDQLTDLEEHICLCVTAINRARSVLLEEIRLHQTHS